MKTKKILLLLMLVIFVGVIAYVILQVHNKSIEQNNMNAKIQENRDASEDGIIEIKDEYFIGATNDVYYNLDKYVGRTIKMKGILYVYEAEGETCYAVVRNSPGCCGNDGLAGLDVKYNGEYPAKDTWVEIVGVVEKEKWQNGDNPILNITSMEETEPGQAFVNN